VRAGFRAIAEAEPGRCVVADATDSPEGVATAILAAVQSRLSPPPP
jgi:dTMP kinase